MISASTPGPRRMEFPAAKFSMPTVPAADPILNVRETIPLPITTVCESAPRASCDTSGRGRISQSVVGFAARAERPAGNLDEDCNHSARAVTVSRVRRPTVTWKIALRRGSLIVGMAILEKFLGMLKSIGSGTDW